MVLEMATVAFLPVTAGQRRTALVHGRYEAVRVLDVNSASLCPWAQRLCKVESTGRFVLVAEADFGEILPESEANDPRLRPTPAPSIKRYPGRPRL